MSSSWRRAGTQRQYPRAPGLPAEQAEILRKGCEEKGLVFVEGGLREYAGGMEVGVAWAACGPRRYGDLCG